MAKRASNNFNMHRGIYINNIEHIEHFHAPTDNSTNNSSNNTQVNNAIASDSISVEVLRPYVDARYHVEDFESFIAMGVPFVLEFKGNEVKAYELDCNYFFSSK